MIIDALKNRYSLPKLLKKLSLSKSSYYYNHRVLQQEDKYQYLHKPIRDIFYKNRQEFGYRRVYGGLRKQGIFVSEKIVRKVMKEEHLEFKIKCKKKYSSYKGEITPAVPNIVNRIFHSDKPNTLWLTDITEFYIQTGKIYLSPIIDCFDGALISWTIGTSPNAELANTMLKEAIATLHDDEKPIIHSDRGVHYRWPEWIKIMEDAGLTRSMSKKGCSPDNAACEGFFGRLKNAMFYRYNWNGVSVSKFIKILDEYLHWYNEDRIKVSLNYMSPMEYRQSPGYI